VKKSSTTQTPAEHWCEAMQSPLTEHVAGHDADAPEQRYGVQDGLPALAAATLAHVPSETAPVAIEQASQAPPHAELQHTELMQLPEVHCGPDEQATPLPKVTGPLSCPFFLKSNWADADAGMATRANSRPTSAPRRIT
jgi:hypothetical protein